MLNFGTKILGLALALGLATTTARAEEHVFKLGNSKAGGRATFATNLKRSSTTAEASFDLSSHMWAMGKKVELIGMGGLSRKSKYFNWYTRSYVEERRSERADR